MLAQQPLGVRVVSVDLEDDLAAGLHKLSQFTCQDSLSTRWNEQKEKEQQGKGRKKPFDRQLAITPYPRLSTRPARRDMKKRTLGL